MAFYPSRDDQILIAVAGQGKTIHRLSVDDLHDPHEMLLSAEEIHMTLVASVDGGPDETALCFAMSTVSAKKLIEALSVAVAKRETLQPVDDNPELECMA